MTNNINVHPIYTAEQLREAFDKVSDPNDWKAPLCGWVHLDMLGATIAAIEFYTATPTKYIGRDGDYILIESVGYRLGPAGDH